MKRVAIIQSNYIPWKGYFDLIAAVDEFILFDDMQYTRRDWRNRNKIKTRQGTQWLTVPVRVKGKYDQRILETEINGSQWANDHWKAIVHNYGKSRCFDEIAGWLEPLYIAGSSIRLLSDLNRIFLVKVCDYLGIQTKITASMDYELADGKTGRLADLCKQAGGTEYVSGPSAKSYIEPELFDRLGIDLDWFDYEGYSEYPQLWGEFEHAVSIIDLLMNCGKEAPNHMRYVSRQLHQRSR